MKYYTKEWYALIQQSGFGDRFRKIPDALYTASDIKKIYAKQLKKTIASDKKEYNTPPFFLPIDLFLEEPFDPEDFLIVNEDSGEMQHPKSQAELVEQFEQEQKQAMEEFENRPPFDPSETIAIFEEMYRNSLRTCTKNYPKWLTDSVDHRLIALGLLPESAYQKYKAEQAENRKKLNKISKAADKEYNRQQIPEQIEEALDLHDAYLLSMKKSGKNLSMTLKRDDDVEFDETINLDENVKVECLPYRKVIFKNAQILEKDAGLHPRKRIEDGTYSSQISFLYREIYQIDQQYEIHMMFFAPNGLQYLTVKCSDVSYSDLEEL